MHKNLVDLHLCPDVFNSTLPFQKALFKAILRSQRIRVLFFCRQKEVSTFVQMSSFLYRQPIVASLLTLRVFDVSKQEAMKLGKYLACNDTLQSLKLNIDPATSSRNKIHLVDLCRNIGNLQLCHLWTDALSEEEALSLKIASPNQQELCCSFKVNWLASKLLLGVISAKPSKSDISCFNYTAGDAAAYYKRLVLHEI